MSEPTPRRPMIAVPSPARRRPAAPVAIASAFAATYGGEADTVPDIVDRRSLREKALERDGVADVLVFTAAGERFGIDLASVEEAIDLPEIHHVPEMPPAMRGVITVRGFLTQVYSPQEALGLSCAAGACALVFRRPRSRLAIVIDDVDDVCPLQLTQLRDAPGTAVNGVVLGVVRQGDTLLSLVDAHALLLACRAIPLLENA